jgi:hypothetical protein
VRSGDNSTDNFNILLNHMKNLEHEGDLELNMKHKDVNFDVYDERKCDLISKSSEPVAENISKLMILDKKYDLNQRFEWIVGISFQLLDHITAIHERNSMKEWDKKFESSYLRS